MRMSLGLIVMLGLVGLGSHAADVPIWKTDEKRSAVSVAEKDGVLGLQLVVNGPFTGFAFDMPTYNQKGSSGKLSVYRWSKDYMETLNGKPLHEKVFTDCVDNARNWVEFPALPAGEYLFLISEAKGALGCWAVAREKTAGSNMYNAGLPYPKTPQLTIRFDGDAPENPFGVSSKPIVEVAAAPAEYVLPADSRVKTHEVMPDTWAFVDGLGRKSLGYEEVGGPRDGKTLAMFYWTWHVGQGRHCVPQNNQKAIDEHPEAIHDFKHPIWVTGAVKNFWNFHGQHEQHGDVARQLHPVVQDMAEGSGRRREGSESLVHAAVRARAGHAGADQDALHGHLPLLQIPAAVVLLGRQADDDGASRGAEGG